MSERFWIMPADDESQPEQLVEGGWWAVVDEQAGGIVAYAGTQDTAQIIRDTFAGRG